MCVQAWHCCRLDEIPFHEATVATAVGEHYYYYYMSGREYACVHAPIEERKHGSGLEMDGTCTFALKRHE